MKKKKMVSRNNITRENLQESSAITLIALVITIIILLILAGVTIATLTGKNGILNQAINAKQNTEKAEVEEIVDIAMMEWETIRYKERMTFEEFLNDKVEKGNFDSVTNNGDGTYTIEKNGYEVIVNDDGRIGEAQKVGRIKAIANLYQTDGSALVDGTTYENIIITINVINKDQLGTIDSIIMKNLAGEEIARESNVVGTGDASFKVDKNGTYRVTIEATTNGIRKTTTVVIKVYGKITVAEFDRYKAEGKIDVVFIDKNNRVVSSPLAPVLTGGMTPLTLNLAGIDFETTTESSWGYSYVAGTGTTGNTESKWANAQTTDGSMFVWIPRYAYKITYYDTDRTTILGYSDARGIVNPDGNVIHENEEGIQTTGDYIVHPAFTSSAANGGGFGELPGLWVGKFEATGEETAVTVKPGLSSLTSMIMNAQYQAGKSAKFGETATLKSHMMKNSEWGAVTYLAHSQYGTNGKKIEQNTAGYIAGGSSAKATIYTTNKTQSTTHNAYGVYDLNGGAYERVASYSNNGSSYLNTNGGISAEDLYGIDEAERSTSTAYKTVYPTSYAGSSKIKGDAVYETSNSSSSNTGSWLDMYAYFTSISYPFFARGGSYDFNFAGEFCFGYSMGGVNVHNGFRVALAF